MFCEMKRFFLQAVALAVASAASAQMVSVKSPDGKNEIRLFTEPVLSYSVLRSGVERVSPTPLALEIEGRGVLGGAGAKVASIDTAISGGKIATPLYKKAFVDESANRTTVAGGWRWWPATMALPTVSKLVSTAGLR